MLLWVSSSHWPPVWRWGRWHTLAAVTGDVSSRDSRSHWRSFNAFHKTSDKWVISGISGKFYFIPTIKYEKKCSWEFFKNWAYGHNLFCQVSMTRDLFRGLGAQGFPISEVDFPSLELSTGIYLISPSWRTSKWYKSLYDHLIWSFDIQSPGFHTCAGSQYTIPTITNRAHPNHCTPSCLR